MGCRSTTKKVEVSFKRYFSATHQGLQQFPPKLFMFKTVEMVDLSHNRIKAIPDSIFLLEHLQKLYLANNQLRSLPAVLGKLSSLKHLDVAHNQISDLAEELSALRRIEEINLSHNRLDTFPSSLLLYWYYLKKLDLSYNFLHFPPNCLSMKYLRVLNLEGNRINSLSLDTTWLPSAMDVVNLRYNGMKHFSVGLSGRYRIGSLVLSGNWLRILDLRRCSGQIGRIDASRNRLFKVYFPVGGIKGLRYLNLSGNLLSRLPWEIAYLKDLDSLDLSFNYFRKLPAGVLGLKQLKWLNLEGNPLSWGYIQWLHAQFPNTTIVFSGVESRRAVVSEGMAVTGNELSRSTPMASLTKAQEDTITRPTSDTTISRSLFPTPQNPKPPTNPPKDTTSQTNRP